MSGIGISAGEGALDARDVEAFDALVAALRRGEVGAEPERAWEPLREGDVERWPAPGSARRRALVARGEEALRRGEVASLVVAGGAGTRFGAAVKGLVPVLGPRTFLELKLEDARRAGDPYGRPVPVAIMTSGATSDAIGVAVRGLRTCSSSASGCCRGSPRLSPRTATPPARCSLAPAGHGDVFRALRDSGTGAELARRGVSTLLFSNVDNLAATLDPFVVGAHLALGRAMTVEVTARRNPGGALDPGRRRSAAAASSGWSSRSTRPPTRSSPPTRFRSTSPGCSRASCRCRGGPCARRPTGNRSSSSSR